MGKTALFPCPLFFLHCCDPVFCGVKLMFWPRSDLSQQGRVVEGVHKHQHHGGWATDPPTPPPQHSESRIMSRRKLLSSITTSPLPLCHLPPFSYLSVRFFSFSEAGLDQVRKKETCKKSQRPNHRIGICPLPFVHA